MIKAGHYGEKLQNAISGGIGGRPIIQQAHPAKAISQNQMECPPKRSLYYDKKNRQKGYTL
jgi:hypothetical protein